MTAEAGAPETMSINKHIVQTTMGTVSVAEAGGGPALVLLHGGGPGASGLSNFGQNLSTLSQHFRVLIPDQPGFGASYRPGADELAARSITEITEDAIVQVLDEFGVDRCTLVGNSLGGAAAIAIAQRHPSRVSALVLMAPGGGWLPVGPTPTEGQKEMYRYFAGEGPTEAKMRAFIRTMVFDHRQFGDAFVRERYEASLDLSHASFYKEYNEAFARRGGMDPLWRDLDRIQAPTLLLWGRDDRTITLDGAQLMLKTIPDVQLHVFGRCGHWVQVERQAEFERLVVDFAECGS